jgi:hypothetical protein
LKGRVFSIKDRVIIICKFVHAHRNYFYFYNLIYILAICNYYIILNLSCYILPMLFSILSLSSRQSSLPSTTNTVFSKTEKLLLWIVYYIYLLFILNIYLRTSYIIYHILYLHISYTIPAIVTLIRKAALRFMRPVYIPSTYAYHDMFSILIYESKGHNQYNLSTPNPKDLLFYFNMCLFCSVVFSHFFPWYILFLK